MWQNISSAHHFITKIMQKKPRNATKYLKKYEFNASTYNDNTQSSECMCHYQIIEARNIWGKHLRDLSRN